MSEPAAEDGRAGWALVQLSELVRRAEELLLDGITLVGPHAHAAMAPDARIELDAAEMRRLAAALLEGVELAEQLELVATRLPAGGFDTDYVAVRDAAAADLASGIVDPRRALLAARVLDVPHGWAALAVSLAHGDVVSAWDTLGVRTLLGRFRGADSDLVAQVVSESGIGSDQSFATCAPEQLDALATGLRRHASGQRAS